VKEVTNSKASVSPARAAAFNILLRVERESSYASELLHSRAYHYLTKVDHSLATELVMGVLRWRALLDSEIASLSSQPIQKLDLEILIALRLGVYQVLWLSRIPARAVINESVELVKRARKRSAGAFVNAVLRRVGGSSIIRAVNGSSAEQLAASSAHPLWLVERWCREYGAAAAQQICRYDQRQPVTAIRLRSAETEERLRAEGIKLESGFMLSFARRVQHEDARTSALKEGFCVIQDETSQLVALLVGRGSRILDCCAAPGGKTLVIADHNQGAHVVAADLHPHRVRLMKKLVREDNGTINNRTGRVDFIAADACALPFGTEFDRILADVPCSGTGTLARNPEIKWRLAPQDIANLQARQLAILRSAMGRVAAGGRIVYSTCSLEREENEDVMGQVLAGNSSFCLLDCRTELDRLRAEGVLTLADISSLTSGPYLRTLPGVHRCDGFFAAILERRG